MKSSTERDEFSQRLQRALLNAKYSPDSPTQLAREFNVRFVGHAITVHAARKWLVGEAIPTQEKLRTLAEWLGVTSEWLRYGTLGKDKSLIAETTPTPKYDSSDIRLIADLQRLDEDYQEIAREVIRLLVRMSKKK